MSRTTLADGDTFAAQVGNGLDRRIRLHQNLIAVAAAVVRGHHLYLGVGCRAEDRRCITGDREVDLARCRRLDLRRAGGKRGERDLVGQPVERVRGPQQRLGAALLVADLQRELGQFGQRHGRRALAARRNCPPATRSRPAAQPATARTATLHDPRPPQSGHATFPSSECLSDLDAELVEQLGSVSLGVGVDARPPEGAGRRSSACAPCARPPERARGRRVRLPRRRHASPAAHRTRARATGRAAAPRMVSRVSASSAPNGSSSSSSSGSATSARASETRCA